MEHDKTAILIVEDEPLIRLAAVEMVEHAGFEAVDAANSTAAIVILEARLDIRIVFTDIDMPHGIDGIRLAALIRDRWPPIIVFLTSGHHAPPDDAAFPRSRFFRKPYQESEVIAAFRQAAAA